MRRFPSEAWCREAIRLFNDDPDAAEATRGWDGDFGLVIDRTEGSVGLAIGVPRGGRLPEPEFLSPAEVEARGPRYFARASEGDWRALLSGTLDPIAAIVQKRLVARGDLTPVIARLQYRGLAERWLARIHQEV